MIPWTTDPQSLPPPRRPPCRRDPGPGPARDAPRGRSRPAPMAGGPSLRAPWRRAQIPPRALLRPPAGTALDAFLRAIGQLAADAVLAERHRAGRAAGDLPQPASAASA
jgi:hypothetical protein